MKITPKQNARLHMLLSTKGLTDMKRELVQQVTNGRTVSSTELDYLEAQELITMLDSNTTIQKASDTMRKRLISKFHELGYHLPRTTKIDMQRVNAFISEKFKYQTINDIPAKEMSRIIAVMEDIAVWHRKKEYNQNK